MSTHRALAGAVLVTLGGGLTAGLALLGAGGARAATATAATAARVTPAPTCVPAALNRSALIPGTSVAVSPLPGSRSASASTQLSFLGVAPSALAGISVRGSSSGAHPGTLRPYSQGDGASFLPRTGFVAGERVTVKGRVRSGSRATRFTYVFAVAWSSPIAHLPPGRQSAGTAGQVQHFHSRADLQPPAITVATSAPQVAPGDIFTSPYSGPGQDGPMVFDNRGALVWFKPLASGTEATNLQVQQLDGKPVLTWWQGYIQPAGFGEGVVVIDDAAYRQLEVLHAGNGYPADLHDFQIGPQDTALMSVFSPIHCNLSAVGGAVNGIVTDSIWQEVDLRTGLVRREWHSLDHVAMSASYQSSSSSGSFPFDFFHLNSLQPQANGTLLISGRNTWALYVVDPHTGQITSTVGGKGTSVKMGPGTATAWQHDARTLPDGSISVFDNGAVPKVHPYSRVVVEKVDPASGSVVLERQYTHNAALLSGSQGDAQPQPNGDEFVGWGASPYFTEYTAAGQVVFDAYMPPGDESYRALRFAWDGRPTTAPALSIARSGHTGIAYASWNGATDVAAWQLLAGSSASRLAPVGGAPRSGFETAIGVPATAGPYLAVHALAADGSVLGTSAATKG
jgi:Arylsulfotransferase (ASST)